MCDYFGSLFGAILITILTGYGYDCLNCNSLLLSILLRGNNVAFVAVCMLWITVYLIISGLLVLANKTSQQTQVCGKTQVSPGNISVSSHVHTTHGHNHCNIYIKAPENQIIVLNVTEIYGFHIPTKMGSNDLQNSTDRIHGECVPKLEIAQVARSGHQKDMAKICGGGISSSTPHVFQSKWNMVKLVYRWAVGDSSRFTVMFNFHPQPTPCPLHKELVCNGVSDCDDSRDELGCDNISPSAQSPDATGYLIAIVIVIAIAVIFGVALWVVCHYRVAGHLWRDRRSQDGSSAEHNHLNPSTPQQSTEVVYVPGPVDPLERQMAAQRDLQIRRQTVQADFDLNLPISIQRSKDGEEGYTHSQRLLQTPEVSSESVRPPPNRTICDGEPPPPYRSNSVGLLDKPSACNWSTHSVYGNCGNSQYFAMSDNNNTRINTAFYGVNGSSPQDPYSLLSCQPDRSTSQAASPRPNTLAVPASGPQVNSSSNNSQSTSSHDNEQLGGQASLLPTYNMAVGKRESES